MLRWARAWGLPLGGRGPSRPSFSRVPVATSSSGGGGGAEPRSVAAAGGRPSPVRLLPVPPARMPRFPPWVPFCCRRGPSLHPRPSARPLPLSYTLLDGEAGSPALVFLHGLCGCRNNFSSIAKAVAQQTGRKVLTVDARNHGDSPHSPDMSYEAMSQDLQDLLPQLGLVPCVLVGHSMGGKTAMLLALQRPDLVDRLIAVDISPARTTSISDFPSYLAAMRSLDIPDELPRSRARKLADEQLSPVIQATGPPQDIVTRQFLLTNLVEVDGRFVWRVNLDALAQHMQEILAFPPRQESYPGPTLFLLGGNSQYVQCRRC
ncbi:protein ABHD11 isoform X3 [Elephas maximus indicus]|uniref:protein ABHD11 isoform X3 n=1 Tax=Elephas maximus indicus TaxID=99487 RepID=UPI002116A10A|nr:protein ABHD11 isoform X3 [Elephas maximus indicus]